MREVIESGKFTVRLGGELVDCMLMADYVKANNTTIYELQTKIKKGEIKRLFIAGRKRSNSVICCPETVNVDSLDGFDMLTDSNGFFDVVINGAAKKACFVEQYAKLQRVTKSAIRKRAMQKDRKFDLVQIKSLSKTPILLAVLRKF